MGWRCAGPSWRPVRALLRRSPPDCVSLLIIGENVCVCDLSVMGRLYNWEGSVISTCNLRWEGFVMMISISCGRGVIVVYSGIISILREGFMIFSWTSLELFCTCC